MSQKLILLTWIIVQVTPKACEDKKTWLKNARTQNLIDSTFDLSVYDKIQEGHNEYLGKGSFGKVVRIKYRPSKKQDFVFAALKIIDIIKGYKGTKYDNVRLNASKTSIEREATFYKAFGQRDEIYMPIFYACFYEDNVYYIISEILETDLIDAMFRKSFALFPLDRKVEMFLEMARGVKSLHEPIADLFAQSNKITIDDKKVTYVHNDIKPHNYMLTSTKPQHVKVIDMGLAHQVGTQRKGGSPRFMPPEKLATDRYTVDPSADIWSLGMSFADMLINNTNWFSLGFKLHTLSKSQIVVLFRTLTHKFNNWFDKSYAIMITHADKKMLDVINRLKKLVGESMLALNMQAKPSIQTVVTELSGILQAINSDSVYLPENHAKLADSQAYFYFKPHKAAATVAKQVDTRQTNAKNTTGTAKGHRVAQNRQPDGKNIMNKKGIRIAKI